MRERTTRWASVEGWPVPLGPTYVPEEDAYNFALYSKHAESVTLLLYGIDDFVNPLLALRLDYTRHKTARIWHCRLPGAALRGAGFYAYSVEGPPPAGRYEWHAFDREKVLVDPYATRIYFPPAFDRRAAMAPGSNAGRAPLGIIPASERPFEWDAGERPRHDADLVLYELHVRGFTRSASSGVSREKRGTYLGLVDKIPYLQELGITAVELMPVFQFDPQDGNYWGYMPMSFFTPHDGYAVRPGCGRQHDELRTMVKALHEAGIEVILDVCYNHTAEGDHRGPVYGFKGIDNSTYYLLTGDPSRPYADFTGTGNSLHTANRYVRKMIVDSLRFWVDEMHVDGFRFDLASVFTRRSDGSISLEDPGIFGDVMADPVLAATRLIAEPWDAAGIEHLGRNLPGLTWSQWNARFRDDVRRFVRGDPGMVASLMCRLYGSDDLFPGDRIHAHRPYQSINYVSCHDGFTLYDLVSYDRKRNWANGLNNADGPVENYGWNCGWEGDESVPPDVRRLRLQQAKNLTCLLLLSNGIPMLRAGDEFLQTQGGNSNPFNQDNETSWLDWTRLEANREFFRFCALMIAFRKAHPSLCRSRFWREDVRWYGADGPVDLSSESRQLGVFLHGASEGDQDLYMMFNAGAADRVFRIQEGVPGEWSRIVDTSLASPDDIQERAREIPVAAPTYSVRGHSVVILTRREGS